jgi:hypothetical protein
MKSGNQVEVRTQTWKKDGGKVVKESLRSTALYDKFLSPVDFRLEQGGTSLKGTYQSGTLSIIGKSTVHVPERTIGSSAFPLWLKARLPFLKKLTGNQSLKFAAVPEDDSASAFRPVEGWVRAAPPDTFAHATGTDRVVVAFGSIKAVWWVNRDGSACQILMPTQKSTVKVVSKAEAQGFLGH